MNPETRPLPALQLPVLFIRRVPTGHRSARTGQEVPVAEGARGVGAQVVALDDDLLAVLPGTGAAPVEIGLRLARSMCDAQPGAAALLFPGHVVGGARGDFEAVPERLLADLVETPPRLDAGDVVVTGWCAAWMRGVWELAEYTTYAAVSGRHVPLLRVVRSRLGALEDASLRPWRSDEILGRRAAVPRLAVDAELDELIAGGRVRVTGALGVGKTRALWNRLVVSAPGVPRLLVDCDHSSRVDLSRVDPSRVDPSRVDAVSLADAISRRIGLWRNGTAGDGSTVGGGPGDRTSDRTGDGSDGAGRLVDALRAAVDAQGVRPWLVVDAAERLDADAASLLDALAAPDVPCGIAIVGRSGSRPSGGATSALDALSDDVPSLPLPPMAAAESEALAGALADGLELPPALLERLDAASAGRPFDFEEMLLRLVHRGLVRRVYGSFFYAGQAEIDLEPSWRQTYMVEDELRRLQVRGQDPLPLRVLASAEQPIDSAHLVRTCARFGVRLDAAWHEPWMLGGWLRWGDGGVELACPALAATLRAVLTQDAVRSLRHALGGVLAHGDRQVGWQAYRLLAGTPEAVPSLLELGRASRDDVSREEMFNALWQEYRRHRASYGDEATELEILWVLLPLARRLGCLGRLHEELQRAVELSRGHEARHVALVALAAELDQEKGRFREAERGLRQALAASAGFEPQRRATLFVRLGALLHREERWGEAREIFHSLLEVAESSVPTPIGATCRFYLGNIALQERRLDDAETLHAEAAEIRREQGLTRARGTSLCALGAVALAVGDYPKALTRYREAEDVLRASDVGPDEWSFAALGVGRALSRLGDVNAAAKVLRGVLDARKGRDDIVSEAIARIEVASNHLERDAVDAALDEARRACFALRLAPEIVLLGDAERLLARILLRKDELDEARQHLAEALRIHGRHDDRASIADDRGVALELALQADDLTAIDAQALELERLLDGQRHPPSGEALHFLLFRAHQRLVEAERPLRDPMPFLRRSYQELLRKTSFLETPMRHPFLFQVVRNRRILEAAAAHHLSMPDLPIPPRTS